ncbi:uncharacterized protein LOC135475605 [Liolophura sinensis]|uniref:uncharacterized protein LOC135475605 n=1 Tax=Liolophura sinensis TaxID=3198878 RepID=UPI0031598788
MARVLPYLVCLCVAVVTFVITTGPRLFTTHKSKSQIHESVSQNAPSLVITSGNTSPDLRPSTTHEENKNLPVPTSGYVVDTIGCRIPKLDPFDDSVRQYVKEYLQFDCASRNVPSVTYQDGGYLRINRTALRHYRGSLAFCQLSAVVRQNGTDDGFVVLPVRVFNFDIQVKTEFVKVQCFNTAGVKYGLNYYAFIQPKPRILDRLRSKGRKFRQKYGVKNPMSIIVVIVDSMSRLNMIRQLPKTRDYLLSTLAAIEFMGYNKVADNTFPNIISLLTGKFASELGLTTSRLKSAYMDKLDYIWKQYSQAGYATFMAEDDPRYTEFNYKKLGFTEPPTDYYYRPLSLAMENERALWSHSHNCVGDRFEIQVLLDWLRDFLRINKNTPSFSFTFLNRLSHDNLNKVKVADGVYLRFFKTLKAEGHLNNSVLFVLSDHGIRFGAIRQTHIGWMEERLPMLFAVLPKWFKQIYPTQFSQLKTNSGRLTTPFDLYETFKDILFLNFTTPPSPTKLTRGVSLFSPVPSHRTCTDAQIPIHWCTCTSRTLLSTANQNAQKVAKAIVAHINSIVNKTKQCAKLSLLSIHQALLYDLKGEAFGGSHSLTGNNQSSVDYRVTLTTAPGEAMFEASVRHYDLGDRFKVLDDISRINRYRNQSYCAHNPELKKYCFCMN